MPAHFGPDLLRGSLDLMVLSVLAGESTYGYQLQQRLRDASRDLIKIQAGTLYPVLHRLEANGEIQSRWDDSTGRKRKWYEITRQGQKRLAAEARQWDQYVACMQALLNPVRATLPAPASP